MDIKVLSMLYTPFLKFCLLDTRIFLKFWEGALGPFRLVKLAWQTPKLGNLIVKVHNYVILVNKKTNKLLHILLPLN